MDPGAYSPRGLVCVCGFKGRVLSLSDSTASRTLSEVCFRGNSVPILFSPVRAGFGPCTFVKCLDAALSPSERAGCAFSTFGRSAKLAQSRDMLISHIDSLLIHFESLGLCVNMQKSILAPSQSITYLGVCLDSGEMRARLSRERVAAILTSLRHFRQGSSVHLKEFQRLLGLMASASAVCHLGLLHMCSQLLWLKS